jgi:PIN domain nuclease of toxin-antitoxin system
MAGLYVLDTVGFINFFRDFFEEEEKLSAKAREIIEFCFDYSYPQYKLSIPSVVFIEIFDKFLKGKEVVLKFRYEILSKIENNPDIEIKAIDKEVINSFCLIDDGILKLEYHDKLITASALQLGTTLITCDSKITKYITKSHNPIKLIF